MSDIKTNKEKQAQLLDQAFEARKNSYCPMSGFAVGAALLGKSGKVYKGCNVENAALSPGICAERDAIYSAVAQGEQDFEAIAIVGGLVAEKDINDLHQCPPCGVCRQVIREFCDDDFPIIVGSNADNLQVYTLAELLPLSFSAKNLDQGLVSKEKLK